MKQIISDKGETEARPFTFICNNDRGMHITGHLNKCITQTCIRENKMQKTVTAQLKNNYKVYSIKAENFRPYRKKKKIFGSLLKILNNNTLSNETPGILQHI